MATPLARFVGDQYDKFPLVVEAPLPGIPGRSKVLFRGEDISYCVRRIEIVGDVNDIWRARIDLYPSSVRVDLAEAAVTLKLPPARIWWHALPKESRNVQATEA